MFLLIFIIIIIINFALYTLASLSTAASLPLLRLPFGAACVRVRPLLRARVRVVACADINH